MKTDFETLLSLGSYIVNHLKSAELIEFEVEKRAELVEAMATEFGVSFSTDDDIKQQAIEEIEDKMGEGFINDDITESEMFNHARKEIIKNFNGENIAGLYLTESLHHVAVRISEFLMNSELVEDVFASDEDLISFLVSKVRVFSVNRA